MIDDLIMYLYLIDILVDIDAALNFYIFALSFASVLVFILGMMAYTTSTYVESTQEKFLKFLRKMSSTLKVLALSAVVSIVITMAIPAKTTMYTMLSLKVGEAVASEISDTDLFNKTVKLIESKIDEQLDLVK